MDSNQKLISGLEDVLAYVNGEKSLRKTVIVPQTVNVKNIRDKLNLSQQEFAERYEFPSGNCKKLGTREKASGGGCSYPIKSD